MTASAEHLVGAWRLVSWILTDDSGKQTEHAADDAQRQFRRGGTGLATGVAR